ncbi:hypothetical protein CHS0354_012762 [Potamilus streckersoni]|uniref:Uncharacterized protein n=1 Tax=Potamilus streckersoni TaxID=2493646 RepID=A0AAE0RVB7_9BIVA|nr:hypothetical protein CHS0354_012762 [Potamilus streckersoni]
MRKQTFRPKNVLNEKMHLIISDVMPALCPFLTLVCLPVIILLVLLYVFREVLGSCPPCRSNKRLDGKTVIITGGNAGIGKETAIDLARRGARVILGCRSAERAQEAVRDIIAKTGNSKVVFYILDLADLDSVRQFAATVLEKESRLHILINNADTGVRANSLHPGMVETEIWTPLKKKYPAWMYNFLMSIIRMFGLNSTEGAQTTIYVSVDEGAEEYNGRYFAKCTLSKENRLALDDSTCALLWDHSMKMCDLK